MPVFNDEEYEDNEVENINSTEVDIESEINSEIEEVERRLSLTSYYKELMKGGLFNDETEYAQQVDKEIREFAGRRVLSLLGIKNEEQRQQQKEVDFPFTSQEVEVLKKLAQRAMSGITQPTIKPVEMPTVAPKIVQKTENTNLTVKTKAVKKKTENVTNTAKSKEILTGKPKINGSADKPEEGKHFVLNGKSYKWTLNPETGKLVKIRTDVGFTPNPEAIPMPNIAQFENIMAANAKASSFVIETNPGSDNKKAANVLGIVQHEVLK